jgi:hypothetical protein
MAEVGLVRFARVALGVAEAVLADYRTKFSKHVFTQPRLLAILCLMRYEDWTLRKAEVRSAESTASCEALWGCPRRPTTPRSTVSLGGSTSTPCCLP